ncbi:MAG: hypothetical protein ACI4HZ_08070 [Ruminococcus sp.]
MINKMKGFISSLTDQEIADQLKDIFDWAKVYKELLEEEQEHRHNNRNSNFNISLTSSEESESTYEDTDDYYDFDPEEFDSEDFDSVQLAVDFKLAQFIQQKVAGFSAEETKEQLDKLNQISTDNFSPLEIAQLQYEIEVCELHLFELTGKTPDGVSICPYCKGELESNAKFCGKCGASIEGI